MGGSHDESIRIFTVASEPSKMDGLYQSLELNGHSRDQIEVLTILNWRGFIDKIQAMKTCVESLPEDTIVCFIDAYDVLCFSDKAEIERKFLEYNCDIIFSSEQNCYPIENLAKYELIEYTLFERNFTGQVGAKRPIETSYKYVNSGGYIGYAGAMRRMFAWKSMEEIATMIELGGDQQFFTQYYLEFGSGTADPFVRVGIDDQQRIFQSLYKVDLADFAFFHGRMYNHILRTEPCFIHLNGYRDYGWTLRHIKTGMDENAMTIFLKKIKESLEYGNAAMDWRLVPFYYGGLAQQCIPQAIWGEALSRGFTR